MAKAKPPTAAQRRVWDRLAELGCMVESCDCYTVTIHHCGTGGGGRKNHDFVIPLCWYHHQGPEGIDRKGGRDCLTKRSWQEKYGSEQSLHEKALKMLGMS